VTCPKIEQKFKTETTKKWVQCPLPENYGRYTTCDNRFAHWRQAGIWDQIIEALAPLTFTEAQPKGANVLSPYLYRHPLRQTRCYRAFIKLAAIRIWLRPYESMA
jgi:transposase